MEFTCFFTELSTFIREISLKEANADSNTAEAILARLIGNIQVLLFIKVVFDDHIEEGDE